MTFPELKFKDYLHPKPKPSGLDVQCKLQHFSLITYAVDPARFKEIIPVRFKLDTVEYQGKQHALMSVVPFIDVDFSSAVYPFPKFTMGQTNYRVYVIDQETRERCVWFLGTTLDSWTLVVPRYVCNYRGILHRLSLIVSKMQRVDIHNIKCVPNRHGPLQMYICLSPNMTNGFLKAFPI